MIAPVVRRARDVAELRTFLLSELRPGSMLGLVLDQIEDASHQLHTTPPTSRTAESRRMKAADLYYVPSSAVDTIEEAAKSIPDDLLLQPWQMPSDYGFAVLERPLIGIDADGSDGTVVTHALLWGPTRIWDDGKDFECMGISSWHVRSDDSPKDQWTGDFEFGRWVPLGRSDWEYGTSVTTFPPIYDKISTTIKASAHEDRCLIAALWGLALALPDSSEIVPRATRRRAISAGVNSKPDVRVLLLPSASMGVTHGVRIGRKHHVRYAVKGHWRNQACGPARSQHRYIYIAAHWKGPKDAPLSEPATVVKKLRG